MPASYVVPVPVNLRPKGGEGGLFRTRVSMLWFQVRPEHTADLEGLVAQLKKQRLELIKSDAIVNGIAAMDLVRWTPSRVYVAMARRSLKGELASFFFAYTGRKRFKNKPGIRERDGGWVCCLIIKLIDYGKRLRA